MTMQERYERSQKQVQAYGRAAGYALAVMVPVTVGLLGYGLVTTFGWLPVVATLAVAAVATVVTIAVLN